MAQLLIQLRTGDNYLNAVRWEEEPSKHLSCPTDNMLLWPSQKTKDGAGWLREGRTRAEGELISARQQSFIRHGHEITAARGLPPPHSTQRYSRAVGQSTVWGGGHGILSPSPETPLVLPPAMLCPSGDKAGTAPHKHYPGCMLTWGGWLPTCPTAATRATHGHSTRALYFPRDGCSVGFEISVFTAWAQHHSQAPHWLPHSAPKELGCERGSPGRLPETRKTLALELNPNQKAEEQQNSHLQPRCLSNALAVPSPRWQLCVTAYFSSLLLGYLRTTRVECGATSQNSDCRSITSQQRYLQSTSCCLHTAFLQGTLSTAANPPPRLTPIPLLGFFPSKWHSDAWASCGKLRLCLQAMLQATTNSLWGAQSQRPPVQPSPNKGVTMGRAPQSPPSNCLSKQTAKLCIC